jgi:type II secretory pathway component GspD/PulD (secretin)
MPASCRSAGIVLAIALVTFTIVLACGTRSGWAQQQGTYPEATISAQTDYHADEANSAVLPSAPALGLGAVEELPAPPESFPVPIRLPSVEPSDTGPLQGELFIAPCLQREVEWGPPCYPGPPESPVVISADASTFPLPGNEGERVSLVVRETPIGTVLTMIAEQHGLNIVTGDQVTGTISVALKDMPLGDALDAILTSNGYTWNLRGNLLIVSRLAAESHLSPFAQGREVRVFSLNYSSASDLQPIVQGLLSPVGQSFVVESDRLDKRRTREQLVVEDLPSYLDRVQAYIQASDRPPQQVLIEAHILEVTLSDELRHGVDIEALLRLSNAELTVGSNGIANDTDSPTFFLGTEGTDLDTVVQFLQNTTDAKTLASPKVLAVNGQEARIQIGSQFGYFVTTTTETSTLQSVEFLEVGVVLRVVPIIAADGRVLMTVMPEVSGGRINPATGLPEEDTAEVETTVMLNDGQPMVIGGLIQEEDSDIQNKIPYLGNLWLVGRLFQKRVQLRERHEIIVALVPRIVPYAPDAQCREQVEVMRATTPLTTGPLWRVNRTRWEPQLPDAGRRKYVH